MPNKRLWLEFAWFYLVAPLSVFLIPQEFVVLGIIALSVHAYLLLRSQGYRLERPKIVTFKHVKSVCSVALGTVLVSALFAWILLPERLFALLQSAPLFMLILAILYPILSAFPQEIIFRTLFFERFQKLISSRYIMIINAAVFAFAHIAYGHPIVFALTFVGGLIFAKAYRNEGFWLAVAMHSVAGNMIFASGLGWYFCAGCAG